MKKKYKKYQFNNSTRNFLIEEDLPEVGWHLYEYDESGKCIADYLQDSFEMAVEYAYEEYKIDKDSWVLID